MSSPTLTIFSSQRRGHMHAYIFDGGSCKISTTQTGSSTCQLDLALCLRQLGLDVDLGERKFRVPIDCWEALQSKTDAILSARGGRVQARKLSSLTGTVISMNMAWGPVTQLDTRHLYALINYVFFLNCWVTLSEGRTALLASTASSPLRVGYLVLPQGRVHPDCNGRNRFRMGRTHHVSPLGARAGVFLGMGGRLVLYISGTPRSLLVSTSNGAHV